MHTSLNFNMQESAILVADSHYNIKNNQLDIILDKILKNEIKTNQIFLLGDIIDFISGESKYFIGINKKVIDKINKLSLVKEIYYLEGNHDYNLKKLFKNVKVVSIKEQPMIGVLNKKSVAMSHGDNFSNKSYIFYTKIIRNTYLLKFLNKIDFFYFISKKIEESLLNKNICRKMSNFNNIAIRRLKEYNQNIVIEGHYHQNFKILKDNKTYINAPSLVCSGAYLQVIKGAIIERKLNY